MKNHRLVAPFSLGFWVVTLCGVASAAPKSPNRIAFMKPVTVVDRIKISDAWSYERLIGQYQLACGETFRGLVLQEIQSRGKTTTSSSANSLAGSKISPTLSIAVVVDRKEAFCSSLPSTVKFALPVKKETTVRPMTLREPRPIVLDEAVDITKLPDGLSIGWQNACRKTAGIIIKPVLENRAPKIEISVARFSSSDISAPLKTNCPRDVRHTKLTTVDLPSSALILAERPGKIETSYFIRLVAAKAVSVSSAGGLIVDWRRNCRESPIGLLFMGDQGRSVALVTAVVPTAPCNGVRTSQAVYSLPGFEVADKIKVKPASEAEVGALGRKFQANYSIFPVAGIESQPPGGGHKIAVRIKGPTCSQTVGLLAAQDPYGNISLGVLKGARDNVCAVAHADATELLDAPFSAPRQGPVPRVFALRVFGNTLN